MNMYELMVMYRSGLKEDEVKKNISELNNKIKELKGDVKSEDYWGLKDLAYEIDKNVKAYYNVLQFQLDTDKLEELKEWLSRQEETLIRNMITKINN